MPALGRVFRQPQCAQPGQQQRLFVRAQIVHVVDDGLYLGVVEESA
ncbi:hypothetical protein ACIHCQ_27180 [Streptomyces sp. NPDC052236]